MVTLRPLELTHWECVRPIYFTTLSCIANLSVCIGNNATTFQIGPRDNDPEDFGSIKIERKRLKDLQDRVINQS